MCVRERVRVCVCACACACVLVRVRVHLCLCVCACMSVHVRVRVREKGGGQCYLGSMILCINVRTQVVNSLGTENYLPHFCVSFYFRPLTLPNYRPTPPLSSPFP